MTDENGLPVKLDITPGQTHDAVAAAEHLRDLKAGQMVLADKAYDADWIRAMVADQSAWANIPPKSNRKDPIYFSPYPTRAAIRFAAPEVGASFSPYRKTVLASRQR